MWVVDYTDPKHPKWIRSRVTEANAKKSTQSGFTEAILNVIRWFITFRPRNVMYRIDAVDRARKIARRLLRSLKLLDPEIFTDDPDDIKTTEFILRGMELWFIGSFNPGRPPRSRPASSLTTKSKSTPERSARPPPCAIPSIARKPTPTASSSTSANPSSKAAPSTRLARPSPASVSRTSAATSHSYPAALYLGAM
jgi:hypothetical protein